MAHSIAYPLNSSARPSARRLDFEKDDIYHDGGNQFAKRRHLSTSCRVAERVAADKCLVRDYVAVLTATRIDIARVRIVTLERVS